jgi:hypothetical protein
MSFELFKLNLNKKSMDNERKALRIKEIMDYYGLSQTEMANKTGIGQSNLSGSLNGKRPCGLGLLNKIAISFPDINRNWLLYGEGTMLNAPSPSPSVSQHNVHGSNNYVDMGSSVGGMAFCPQCGRTEPFAEAEEIPVAAPIVPTQLTTAPDTDVLEAVENADGGLEFAPIIAQGVDIKMWHRIKDTAMAPKYEPGDLLAIWPYEQGKERPIPGKPYVINTVSNGMIVRKLFPCAEGYIAKSLSPDEYPEFLIEKEEVVRIFRIIIAARM